MKFICLKCDKEMDRKDMKKGDDGAFNIIFECSECGHAMAMLANPDESRVMKEAGVGSRPTADRPEDNTDNDGIKWSSAALESLEKIPPFAQPMAKMGVEKFAAGKGYSEITPEVMDEAKKMFGM